MADIHHVEVIIANSGYIAVPMLIQLYSKH